MHKSAEEFSSSGNITAFDLNWLVKGGNQPPIFKHKLTVEKIGIILEFDLRACFFHEKSSLFFLGSRNISLEERVVAGVPAHGLASLAQITLGADRALITAMTFNIVHQRAAVLSQN